MSIGHPPSVFVSSTCYDLAQIRRDLREFIVSLGMNPVLSEFSSFPVDPNLNALGNCLAAVKNNADIFVLVVGGRYGSQTKTGKSVTNLEYLEARAKGIPRYVFVQKPILTALSIWKKNQSGDFSDVVDSPKLFEFVESLRDPKENWIFPFESAQEISETLRSQLAYLFMDALAIRAKVIQSDLPETLQELSGAALMLAIQKPYAWEGLLFSQVLSDEMSRFAIFKKDLDYGLALGHVEKLNGIVDICNWAKLKMSEIVSFVQSSEKIVDVALNKAVGAPGEPGDVEEIVYTGKRLAQVYRRLLEWTSEFNHVEVDDNFNRLIKLLSKVSCNMITEFEQFASKVQRQLSNAVRRYEETKEPQSLEIFLSVTCPDMSDLHDEIRRIDGLIAGQ